MKLFLKNIICFLGITFFWWMAIATSPPRPDIVDLDISARLLNNDEIEIKNNEGKNLNNCTWTLVNGENFFYNYDIVFPNGVTDTILVSSFTNNDPLVSIQDSLGLILEIQCLFSDTEEGQISIDLR